VTATCLSNRLCHNLGDSPSVFVRGPYALDAYDLTTCAEICLYSTTPSSFYHTQYTDKSTDETTSFFPRVTVCADGSYCCDKFPNCCQAGEGVFLNDVGQTVASPPATVSQSSSTSSLSSLSPTTSTTTFIPTTGSQTPTAISAPSSASNSTYTPSAAAGKTSKVGLGVGIPLGILVLGGLAAIIIAQRRRRKKAKGEAYLVHPFARPPSM
jgi:hypothetical protein